MLVFIDLNEECTHTEHLKFTSYI